MLFHSFGDFTITLKYENADNKEWVSVSKLLNGTVYQSGIEVVILSLYHGTTTVFLKRRWRREIKWSYQPDQPARR